MEDIIELLHNIGKLKDLKRTGWVLRKVPNPESVADHSFRISIMALLLADKLNLDKNKCVQMALIHDVGESLAGDITPHDKVNKKEKHELEKKAMKSLFKKVNDNKILDLWNEYEECKSPESKFVYELDKIEMLLQAFEYEQRYKDRDIDLSEFWSYVEERVKEPKIIEILEILKRRKANAE